jgi:hypothetical protein
MYQDQSQDEYFFSGTFGDAYVALCKLDSIAQQQSRKLRRLCRFPGFDKKIGELAALFNGISYQEEYIHFETNDQMRVFAFENRDRYINIFFDGNGRGNEPDDPEGIVYNPYPNLNLRRPSFNNEKKHVGIQLKSGGRAEKQRRLDIKWISEFAQVTKGEQIDIHLFGLPNDLSAGDLEAIDHMPSHVKSHIDNDFTDWLGHLAAVDYLIAPEGLATFFALSQKVPTIVLYNEKEAVLRLAKEWHNHALCMRPIIVNDNEGMNRWMPMPPQQALSVVLSRLAPERC